MAVVGIDEHEVGALLASLEAARLDLDARRRSVVADLAAIGWSDHAAIRIAATASWLDDVRSDLRRRLSRLWDPGTPTRAAWTLYGLVDGLVAGPRELHRLHAASRVLRSARLDAVRFRGVGSAAHVQRAADRTLATLETAWRTGGADEVLRLRGAGPAVRRLPRVGGALRVAGEVLPVVGMAADAATIADPGHDGARGWVDRGVATASFGAGAVGLAAAAGVAVAPAVLTGAAVVGIGAAVYGGASLVVDNWDGIVGGLDAAADWSGDRIADACAVVGSGIDGGIDWASERLDDAGRVVDAVTFWD